MPSASATRVRADHPGPWLAIPANTALKTDTLTEATREEMSAARLPLAYRDSCAHLLIPLNRCRHEEYYLPWKCEVRQHFNQRDQAMN
jgi:NADH dehydrogenase (ubiquinone) 1 beta subcomplex subunit 7